MLDSGTDSRTVTLLGRLEALGGRPTGFDYLRLVLALMVMARHALDVSYGRAVADPMWPVWSAPIIACILPMFFALSGFLVAGSLERTPSLWNFAALRALRIMPALAVEVLLSAFIIGPLLTTTPMGDYFRDPKFRTYLLNMLGDVHFHLPGVFLTNPLPETVNDQLWTVPWELACYVSLVALAVSGLVRRRAIFLGLIILACAALWAIWQVRGQSPIIGAYSVHSPVLVASFLAGVAVFTFRGRLAWSGVLAAGCAITGWVLLELPGGQFAAPLPLAYVTVWLGLLNPPKMFLLCGADYSYGIYLYGFVIQQTVAWLGAWTHAAWINLALSVPAAALVAAVSWTFVEKPALALRKRLPHLGPRLALRWRAASARRAEGERRQTNTGSK
jgi:peptidoglycan/LPS O-acetylase OafA/YrhL